MKRFVPTLLFVWFCLNCNAQERLNNQSILDMIDMKFGEDVIVSKILNSTCNFDTSISELKKLKEKGVSNIIIVEMINMSKKEYDKKDSFNTISSGIYFIDSIGTRKIYPTSFSGTKTNTLGSALSYGIASAKIKSTMIGSTSKNITKTTSPEFYFVFDRNKNNTPISDWWFCFASSPNQFSLVKLNSKHNRRELDTGSVNIYAGSSIGVDEKQTIKFDIEPISDFEFKVKTKNLKPGEYCFFYQGSIPQGGYSNQSVFDFSIGGAKFSIEDVVWVKLDNGKIKRCTVYGIEIKDGDVYYIGQTFSLKDVRWKESDCRDKKSEFN